MARATSQVVSLAVALVACASVPRAAAPPAPEPKKGAAAPPALVEPSFHCDDEKSDECWTASLAHDVLDQERAWSLLRGATFGVGTNPKARIAQTVELAVEFDSCELDEVSALHLSCEAGLAAACMNLFQPGGCLADALLAWSGASADAPLCAGAFVHATRDLPFALKDGAYGTIRRGANLIALGVRERTVVVVVPDPRIQVAKPDWYTGAPVLELPKDAVTRLPVELVPSAAEPLVVHSFSRGVHATAELSSTTEHDAEPAWRATSCEPIAVVEERQQDGKHLQRIRQEQYGIVLEGWLDQPILRSWGPARCQERAFRYHTEIEQPRFGIPSSYVWVEAEQVEAKLARFMKTKATLTMIEFDEEKGPRCVTKEWDRGRLRDPWHDVSEPQDDGSSVQIQQRWVESVSAEGTQLVLTPTIEQKGRRAAYLRCVDFWEVVAFTDRALEVMSGDIEQDKRIWGYHPDDVVRWWLHPADCEAALAQKPNYSLAELRQRNAGVERLATLVIAVPGC